MTTAGFSFGKIGEVLGPGFGLRIMKGEFLPLAIFPACIRRTSMAKEYKGPRNPDPIQAVLEELQTHLAKYTADPSHKEEKDAFLKGCHAGYADGLKRAINIIQYEIGIRQDPPNINYPGERPQ
jgi:hypothetical protein